MGVGTSDIKFYVRGPGARRSGIRFEIKIDKFREIKFTAVSGAPNISAEPHARVVREPAEQPHASFQVTRRDVIDWLIEKPEPRTRRRPQTAAYTWLTLPPILWRCAKIFVY